MKKTLRSRQLYVLLLSSGLALPAMAQNVAINTTGAPPANANALLELDATNRGLLIPRMTYNERVLLPGPTAGLWVYQTDNSAPYDPKNAVGLYYHDGATWNRMATGSGWSETGNTGTNVATNFIGTVAGSNDDMRINTNGTANPRITISGTNGYVGVGTTAPAEALHINGAMRLFKQAPVYPGTSYSLTSANGVMRYNDALNYHEGGGVRAIQGMNTTNGSANITIPSTAGLAAGMYVSGTGIPVGATILNVVNATTLQLSANCTATNQNQFLRVGPLFTRLENIETVVTGQDYTDFNLVCGAPGQTQGGVANGQTSAAAPQRLRETPFPTSQTAQSAGSRVQYLILGSELANPPFNLCAGNITQLAVTSLDDDPNVPVPGCVLNINVKVATTALASLPATGIDQATGNGMNASPVRFNSTNLRVGAGDVVFPLNPPYFWNGTDNIIIEINYLKSAVLGVSPRVLLTTGLTFQSTIWSYVPGSSVNPGSTHYTTPAVFPAGLLWGLNTTRPVFKVWGQVKQPTPFNNTGDYTLLNGHALMVGTPQWAATAGVYRGPGTIRAQDRVFDAGLQLSDHVFDRYFDDAVKPEDAVSAADHRFVPLNALEGYLADNRHLPSMPSRAEWEVGDRTSLGELSTGLWRTVEEQALYIAELERDLRVLEEMTFANGLTQEEWRRMRQDVERSPRLTDDQRKALLDRLEQLNQRSKP